MNSRLTLVKKFIDYIYESYKKEVYKYLRYNEYFPLEIYSDLRWTDKKDDFCRIEEMENYFGNVSTYLEDFYYTDEYIFGKESFSIYNGAEQIALIFDDEVYKISPVDVCSDVQDLWYYLGEYGHFIAGTNFLGTYKGIYIYSQERVEVNPNLDEDELHNSTSNLGDFFEDECLVECIERELDYDEAAIQEFESLISSSGYSFDIHSENWGIIDGKVKIFDPIYI